MLQNYLRVRNETHKIVTIVPFIESLTEFTCIRQVAPEYKDLNLEADEAFFLSIVLVKEVAKFEMTMNGEIHFDFSIPKGISKLEIADIDVTGDVDFNFVGYLKYGRVNLK